MHKTQHRVIYADTDAGQVVYYANYLRWFEIGRKELCRGLMIDFSALDNNGIIVPVVEVKCNYFHPARYDDVVTIETRIAELKEKSIRFEYKITRKSDKKLRASGYTVNVFVDKKKLKSVRIPDNVVKRLKIG